MLLIFTACLIASPVDCRPERINLSAETSAPQQCLLMAQPTLAAWSVEHEGRRVVNYRCVPTSRIERRA